MSKFIWDADACLVIWDIEQKKAALRRVEMELDEADEMVGVTELKC